MMMSPGTAIKNAVAGIPFYFSVLVSGLAFGLFFLQTGLDLYKTGQQSLFFAIAVTLIGGAFGIVVIPALAVIVWVITKAFGNKKTIKWTISAFCLSYSGALVYCVFGIVASVALGWRTAVAFGVTGVLWAIGPMISTIREIVEGKIYLCVILAAATGSAVLFCWSFIGRY
jgi:hypothetical protein